MKYVLFYESSDDIATLAPLHFAAHKERWAEFHALGTLLLIGPFTDRQGAMSVFTTREAAEEFASGDPFVEHGVVRHWSIREWNEPLT